MTEVVKEDKKSEKKNATARIVLKTLSITKCCGVCEYNRVNMNPQRYVSYKFYPSGTSQIRLCRFSTKYATSGNHSNLNGKSQDFTG